MSIEMYKVILGTLLHDIGKLIQRAEDKENVNQELEASICPVKNGYYTHRHVLFTDAFFNWIKQKYLELPDGVDYKQVNTFAINHHSPSDKEPLTWIIALADRYSAGMDRRADEENIDSNHPSKFKYIPLKCIFDEVVLDAEKFGQPTSNVCPMTVLNPCKEEDIMPMPFPKKGVIDDLPKSYKRLLNDFKENFSILCNQNLPLHLFEEALLGLLERFTWAVPSSTMDCPDISLFDHSKTTAAIAAVMFKYHQAKNELNDLTAIKDEKIKKFCFLMGDLSGIQATIFTLEKQGVKGVNKVLRARSFMLSAIAEAAALKIRKAMDLPFSCVIQQAGGRFLMLLPALDENKPKIDELRRQFDKWLLETYTGTLSLNIAVSEPFEGAKFKDGGLVDVLSALSMRVEEAKYRPLATCPQGVMKREYPTGKACSVCGIRPARNDKEDDGRCYTCQREFTLGAHLPESDFLVWGVNRFKDSQEIFDLHFCLSKEPPQAGMKELLSVQQIGTHSSTLSKCCWARRYLANYVPLFEEKDRDDLRLDKIQDAEPIDVGKPKTFAHIGACALEIDDEDQVKGKPFLAIIKADVDRLGFIFSYGFRRKETQKDRFTISRLTQLSRMLNLYFTGYLPGLIQRDFPDTYTVYAGGDDLFLISPWRQAFELAARINETFRRYTGNNPNITLSAGISLMHSNYPVNRAVEETEKFLNEAKNSGRNCICAMYSKAMPWDVYAKRLKDAKWIYDKMNGAEAVSTGFIYNILKISEDAVALYEKQDISKANWIARLGYHLIRNVKGKNKEEQRAKAVDWLKQLGMNENFGFTGPAPNIYEWRLPLSIALLRNRKP
ncbi:MAG: type III-A CRISPR-associated protein Cas10/Csm1 [Dissulfuribacterales bacterium]